MEKLEKSISNKLKLGKYSLFELLIPLCALLSTTLINWEKYVGEAEYVVRGLLFIFALEFWKTVNRLKKRRVRSYKAHWLIKAKITHLNHFSTQKQFIG